MTVPVRVDHVSDLGWLTGPAAANRTDRRFGVYATDLGICWDAGDGSVLIAFGDTYGKDWGGDGAGPAHAQWRFNVLARSRTSDPAGGVDLHEMVADDDNHARQILDGASRRDEITVIPTAGIAVGGRQLLHYMSVRQWGGPHGWRTNHSGLAYSDDGGANWHIEEGARWINRAEGDHPFQLGAFAHGPDGEILLYGTKNGRRGPAFLAKAAPEQAHDPRGYRYWTGDGWSADEFAAIPVIEAPVGELSVQYDAAFECWLATHLSEARRQIILRTADTPTGPFTEGEKILDDVEYPGMYGGFLYPHPGRSAAVLVSQWGPYNVRLLRLELSR